MTYFHVPDAILFEFRPLLRNSTCVCDRSTDGRTDGHTVLQRCENAFKNKYGVHQMRLLHRHSLQPCYWWVLLICYHFLPLFEKTRHRRPDKPTNGHDLESAWAIRTCILFSTNVDPLSPRSFRRSIITFCPILVLTYSLSWLNVSVCICHLLTK